MKKPGEFAGLVYQEQNQIMSVMEMSIVNRRAQTSKNLLYFHQQLLHLRY
jgi:hypothetical protein